VVFQAGTKRSNGDLQTAGGRVLGVTTSGETLQTAIDNAYRAVREIHFDGMQYRNDIGAKGLKRWSRIETAGT
jgi:phosphoribosylamine--glycine ligase